MDASLQKFWAVIVCLLSCIIKLSIKAVVKHNIKNVCVSHFIIAHSLKFAAERPFQSSLYPAITYLFKVNNRNIRKRFEICSKLTIKLLFSKHLIATGNITKKKKNYIFEYSILPRTHQRWTNVEASLIVNIHQRCFNVDVWLKMKIEPTYIYRRCFNIDKTTLKKCL